MKRGRRRRWRRRRRRRRRRWRLGRWQAEVEAAEGEVAEAAEAEAVETLGLGAWSGLDGDSVSSNSNPVAVATTASTLRSPTGVLSAQEDLVQNTVEPRAQRGKHVAGDEVEHDAHERRHRVEADLD